MRTPEEIKNGLKHCGEIGCRGCPYHDADCSPHNPFQKCANDALSYIQNLENQIADLGKKVPKWIDVDERLPENDALVVALYRCKSAPDIYYIAQERYDPRSNMWQDGSVRHWLTLPGPPKEEHHGQKVKGNRNA